MRFRDFHAGQVLESDPYEVTERQILEFARQWDPQWFHVDPEAAAQGHFGGLIASGLHTCVIAMRLLVPLALEGSESLASPGLSYVKWPNPTRPGDVLRLTVTVLEARTSVRRPSLGIVRWRWVLMNQRQEAALDLEATSLFDLSREPPAQPALPPGSDPEDRP
jgi:acyl dehydratase